MEKSVMRIVTLSAPICRRTFLNYMSRSHAIPTKPGFIDKFASFGDFQSQKCSTIGKCVSLFLAIWTSTNFISRGNAVGESQMHLRLKIVDFFGTVKSNGLQSSYSYLQKFTKLFYRRHVTTCANSRPLLHSTLWIQVFDGHENNEIIPIIGRSTKLLQ